MDLKGKFRKVDGSTTLESFKMATFNTAASNDFINLIDADDLDEDDTDMDIEMEDSGIHRKLEASHLEMIAIGGTIGTGLFLVRFV